MAEETETGTTTATTTTATTETDPATASASTDTDTLAASILMYIPVKDIEIPAENQGRSFKPDAKKLKELEDSIREQGLLQPIGVRQKTNGSGSQFVLQQFVLQYGEQRLNQFKKVFGEEAEIPALVRPEGSDSLQDAAAENLGRTGLSAVEKALLIARVRKDKGWDGAENTKQVAAFLKLSVTSVTQLEKLLLLANTPALQKALHKDELSAEAGIELSRVNDPKLRDQFHARAKEIEVEAEKARLAEAEAKAEEAAAKAAEIKADSKASDAAKKKAKMMADLAKQTAKNAAAKVAATEKAGGKPKKVTAPAVRQAMNEGGVKTTPSKPAQARTSQKAAPGTSTRKSTAAGSTTGAATGAATEPVPGDKKRNISAWLTVVDLLGTPGAQPKRANQFSKLFQNWWGTGSKPVSDEAFVAGLKSVFAD